MKKKLCIFTIFFVIFILTTLFVYQNSALSLQELKIIDAVQTILKNVPLSIAKFITSFGHEQNWRYSLITAIIILLICKKYKETILYVIALPLSTFLYSFIKDIIARPRPPMDMRLIEVSNTSYPSGHSATSMVTYGLLIYFVCKYVKNKPLKVSLISLLSCLILLVGFSRVWVGVHFPTDVIGGFSLGICIICIFAIINETKLPFTK